MCEGSGVVTVEGSGDEGTPSRGVGRVGERGLG